MAVFLLAGVGDAWGAEALYVTLTMADNGSDSGTAFSTSTTIDANFATPSDSIKAVTSASRVYPGNSGWKFGASSNPGSITFSLAHTIKKVTKIEVSVKRWTTKNVNLNCNSIGAQTVTSSSYSTKTYTYATATDVSSITLATTKPSSGDYRCYVQWIKIYYDKPAAGTSVTLSKAASSNGSFTLTQGGSAVTSVTTTSAAQTVTVTGSPSAGYYLSNVTQSGASATPTITKTSATTYTIQYAKGCSGTSTITATFSPIWYLKGDFNEWGTTDPLTNITSNVATVTKSLSKTTAYEFKVYNAQEDAWYGNNGKIIDDISGWTFSTSEGNCKVFATVADDYTFKYNISTKAMQVEYPDMTHPNDAYVYLTKWWDCYVHYWNTDGEGDHALVDWGYDLQLSRYEEICETDYWCVPILDGYPKLIMKDNAGDAGNSTGDQTTDSNAGKYITHNGSAWVWNTFGTYTITFAGNGNTGGSMSNVTGICPNGSTTLAANGYTKTGYTFSGWKTNVAVTANGSPVAANGIVPAGATISSINSNITLTAQWSANVYTVTSTLSNCTSDPAIPSSYTYTGSAANLTYTISPNSGYRLPATVTVSGSTYTWDSSTGELTLTGTITGNVSITVAAVQTHSISWYVGGTGEGNKLTTGSQTTVVDHGGSITMLPSEPSGSACDKTFVGWTNTSSYTHGTSPLYSHNTASFPAINADASFYAVYAVGASGFTRATSESQLTAGTQIIIGYEADHTSGKGVIVPARSGDYTTSSTLFVRSGTTSGSSTNATIDMSTIVDASAYLFTLEDGKNSGYLAIKHSDGHYIGHNGRNSASSANTSIDNDGKNDFSFAVGDDDVFTITNKYGNENTTTYSSKEHNYQYLRYNSTSTQERYAIYETGMNDPVIYIKNSYTGHTLTCSSCSNEVTVSFSDPGSGNTMEVAKGVTSISNGDNVKTCSAVELTVTLTPAEHYSVTNLTATGVTGVTTSNVGNVYTVIIPADKTGTLTLSPTFTEDAHLAINWSVNGSLLDLSSTEGLTWVYSGGKITALPSTPSVPPSCSSKTFAGWSEQNSGTVEKDAMYYGDRFTSAGPKNITSAKTYYAVFATAYDATVDVPHEYDSETFGTSSAVWTADGDQTLNGVSWSLSAEGTSVYFGNDGTKGQQVGSGSYPASELTLSTSDISGTIKSVTITTSGASSINATVGVSVGSTAFLTGESPGSATTAITSSSADYTFTGSAEGEIAISWENSSPKKAIYFKQIVVEYTTEEDGTAYSECITRCCPQYAIALANSGSASGGTFEASASSACEDTEITVSATPSVGYAFSSWDIYKTGASATKITPASSSSAETTFDMPAYGVTVNATFRALAVYTITWKVGDDTWSDKGGSTSVYEGQKVSTLPTAPDPEDFCGDAFIGWTTAENYVHGSSPLYTTASSFPAADGNQTFYAVFADYNE